VFGFHLWLYGGKPGAAGPLGDALNELRVGLVCFFVLSGYLLFRAFARAARRQAGEPGWGRYLARRGARILPAYYVSLLGTLALLGAASGAPGVRLPEPGGLPLFLFFAQNYSDGTIMRLNPVTWTLCLEVAFYVLLPVIGLFAYHVARGRRRPQVVLLLALIAAGLAWNTAGHLLGWEQPATKALPAYLPYFCAGMLVALLLATPDGERRVPARWAAGLAAGGVALVAGNGVWHGITAGPDHDPAIMVLHDLPAGAGFALLVAAAAAGGGRATAWLRARWLAGLGVISYGFYLWHVPLMLFVKEMSAQTPGPLALAALVTPLAVLAGLASWLWVERPLLAAVDSRLADAPARA
jgi:peptidoglycan/LPS O-acetylase OafA/YrhL